MPPRYFVQNAGEKYSIARTPVRSYTRSRYDWTHAVRSVTDNPPDASRSSTGGRSPLAGRAVSTKWSASAIASPGVASGWAKWYAPITRPAAFAWLRLAA